MTVREFGAQQGSCPVTKTVAVPPPAGTVQMLNAPICAVKTMAFPSGDQSGSVALLTPAAPRRRIAPPDAETVYNAARPLSREAKQIV